MRARSLCAGQMVVMTRMMMHDGQCQQQHTSPTGIGDEKTTKEISASIERRAKLTALVVLQRWVGLRVGRRSANATALLRASLPFACMCRTAVHDCHAGVTRDGDLDRWYEVFRHDIGD